MTKFTIITCTFNASKFIDRTLGSVRRQTYPCIEHFIIDGVSRDDTVKKAQTYAYDASYPVIVKSEPDKGLYDAMNKGIQLAKGDYLIFLNAGDIFASDDVLTKVAEQIKDNRPGVIYGDTDIVDENGNFVRKRRLAPPEKLTWKSFKEGMLVCHQSFYARTDIARKTPYNLGYKLSADVDWCIRIMKQTNELWNTHTTLCAYLEGGMSVKSHKASLKERFRIMCDHYGTPTTIMLHLWFVVRAVLKR